MVLLCIGGYSGYRQGLFIGILSILAFFIGIVVAFRFMHWGAEMLSERVQSLSFMLPFVSFVIIFLVVTITIRILAYILKKVLYLTLLGAFDSFAGAILGMVKWAIMISLLFWVAHAFEFQLPDQFTDGSVIFPLILPLAPTLVALLDDYTPIIETTIATIRDMVNTSAGDTAN